MIYESEVEKLYLEDVSCITKCVISLILCVCVCTCVCVYVCESDVCEFVMCL